MLIWELDTFACIDDVLLYFDPFACVSESQESRKHGQSIVPIVAWPFIWAKECGNFNVQPYCLMVHST